MPYGPPETMKYVAAIRGMMRSLRRVAGAEDRICPAKRMDVRLATNCPRPKQKMHGSAGRLGLMFRAAFERQERRFGYNPRIAGEMAEWLKAAVC